MQTLRCVEQSASGCWSNLPVKEGLYEYLDEATVLEGSPTEGLTDIWPLQLIDFGDDDQFEGRYLVVVVVCSHAHRQRRTTS